MSKPIITPIPLKQYPITDAFLEKYLYHGKRPRTYDFLLGKLRKYPDLFLGLSLDDELIGVVEGFPKDDFILMSEIAVDARFRGRGFGSLLIRNFEKAAKKYGNKIKLGAQDEAINLYIKNKYVPSLFLQVYTNRADAVLKKLRNIINVSKSNGMTGIELSVKKIDMKELSKLKTRFKPVSAQYLFTKKI